jgi:hypothetical protein
MEATAINTTNAITTTSKQVLQKDLPTNKGLAVSYEEAPSQIKLTAEDKAFITSKETLDRNQLLGIKTNSPKILMTKAVKNMFTKALNITSEFFLPSANAQMLVKQPFSWRPNTEPDLRGYKVYTGTSSRDYDPARTITINCGPNDSSCAKGTVSGLTLGVEYCSAATAFDSANESVERDAEGRVIIDPETGKAKIGYSNEVCFIAQENAEIINFSLQ